MGLQIPGCASLKKCTTRFFPTAVALTAGGFAGIGVDTALGNLGINFLTFTGGLPALGMLGVGLFISSRLLKTFENSPLTLVGTQFLLATCAVVLSKCITAAFMALDKGIELSPLVLPFMLTSGLTIAGLLLVTFLLKPDPGPKKTIQLDTELSDAMEVSPTNPFIEDPKICCSIL